MKKVMGNDKLSKFDKRFGPDFPSDKEIPAILILKRKAIRVYPDNQKIALYYSQALDKYVSIPFGPGTASLGVHINEAAPTPPKPNKDVQRTIDALNAAGLKTVADLYRGHKEEEPVNRALRGISRKMPIKDILKLPHEERKAMLKHVNRHIEQADIPELKKTGIKLGLYLRRKYHDATEKSPTPKPIPESFRERVSILREERQLDEAWNIPIQLGLQLGRYASKKGGEWLAKRQAKKQAKKSVLGGDKSTFTKGTKKGRGKGVADAALTAAGALKVAKDIGTATFRGSPEYTEPGRFSLDAKERVGGPGQRATLSPPEVENWKKMNAIKESYNNLDVIRHIVENDIKSHQLHFGDRTVPLNNSVAKKVLKIYESVNKTNKKKIENMLNEDVTSFRKVINFAIRQ